MYHVVRFLPAVSLKFFALMVTAILLISCQPVLLDTSPAEGESAVGEEVDSLVASVVSAPITPDGNVAGAKTDLVINLNTSLDPSVPGRTLLEGKQIKITFPDAFVNTGLPVETVFTPDCGPTNFQCSTGILLQGWPQHPILPMFPPGEGPPEFYTVDAEGTHTIVFTAKTDVEAGMMAPGPGIKQIHLVAVGFTNPEAGVYDIQVETETGPDGAMETGIAQVEIIPKTVPKISITSVFNEGAPNTIYQEASVGTPAPLPYDFLLWDDEGQPLDGVTIEMEDETSAVLVRGEEIVGQISIDAPEGAMGQKLVTEAPSEAISAPVSGVPTARLTASFTAGSVPGDYVLTFALNEGNSVQTFVSVEE